MCILALKVANLEVFLTNLEEYLQLFFPLNLTFFKFKSNSTNNKKGGVF